MKFIRPAVQHFLSLLSDLRIASFCTAADQPGRFPQPISHSFHLAGHRFRSLAVAWPCYVAGELGGCASDCNHWHESTAVLPPSDLPCLPHPRENIYAGAVPSPQREPLLLCNSSPHLSHYLPHLSIQTTTLRLPSSSLPGHFPLLDSNHRLPLVHGLDPHRSWSAESLVSNALV